MITDAIQIISQGKSKNWTRVCIFFYVPCTFKISAIPTYQNFLSLVALSPVFTQSSHSQYLFCYQFTSSCYVLRCSSLGFLMPWIFQFLQAVFSHYGYQTCQLTLSDSKFYCFRFSLKKFLIAHGFLSIHLRNGISVFNSSHFLLKDIFK